MIIINVFKKDVNYDHLYYIIFYTFALVNIILNIQSIFKMILTQGYFYIYEVGEYYRTGATKNLKLRFKTHNSSHPQTIRPIIRLKVDDPFKLESCVNNLLNQFRIKKNT